MNDNNAVQQTEPIIIPWKMTSWVVYVPFIGNNIFDLLKWNYKKVLLYTLYSIHTKKRVICKNKKFQ